MFNLILSGDSERGTGITGSSIWLKTFSFEQIHNYFRACCLACCSYLWSSSAPGSSWASCCAAALQMWGRWFGWGTRSRRKGCWARWCQSGLWLQSGGVGSVCCRETSRWSNRTEKQIAYCIIGIPCWD